MKRIIWGALLIVGLTVLTFFFVRLSPGDPAARTFDPGNINSQMQRSREQLGLNQSLTTQFAHWMSGFLRGDWGVSYAMHRPVREILAEKLPNTLWLAVPVLLIQIVVGVLLGIFQATRERKAIDNSISALTLALYALPAFWVALLLLMVFSQKLGWFPSSQMNSFSFHQLPFWQQVVDRAAHMVLPVLSLSLVSVAVMTRYVRNGLIEVQQQRYILAARARGLSERIVIWKHAFKNILVPVVTVIGQHLPVLIGGSIVIELIFSWPGMGRLVVFSATARDYPVIIASTFVMAIIVVLGNLLADLLAAWIDPRIRLDE